MKYSAWRTWWLIARLGSCRHWWRLNIRLANKVILSGYRYTPGDWIDVRDDTSVQPHSKNTEGRRDD